MNENTKLKMKIIQIVLFVYLVRCATAAILGFDESHYKRLITQIFTIPANDTYFAKLRSEESDDDDYNTMENCEMVCVPYNVCVNGSVLITGDDLIDWKISTRTNGNSIIECENFQILCCLNDNGIESKDSKEQTGFDKPFKEENDQIDKTCGYRYGKNNKKFESRISNGEMAQLGEFPWMVAIFLQFHNSPDDLQYHGGGSLIHPKVILTAAHILIDQIAENLVVRAGEWNMQNTDEEFGHQDRPVSQIIAHINFYSKNLINDIALLIVSQPFELTLTVNIICLPPQSIVPEHNDMCLASGWGKNLFGLDGEYQAILKKIELPIVSQRVCQHQLRKTRLGPFYRLDRSLICAGGKNGKDTCKGDGGSALVCEVPHLIGRYYQSGIVAGGIGCATTAPAIYVNVALFNYWILQQLTLIDINFNTENSLKLSDFYEIPTMS